MQRARPARAFLAEDFVPVDLARLQLANCRVPTVGATQRCANSEAALSKVQSIARGPAHAVILRPYQVRLVHPALEHKIFEQPPHRVIGQCSHDGGLQPEASPQSASDVVFSAALPSTKATSGMYTFVPRIET